MGSDLGDNEVIKWKYIDSNSAPTLERLKNLCSAKTILQNRKIFGLKQQIILVSTHVLLRSLSTIHTSLSDPNVIWFTPTQTPEFVFISVPLD